VASMDSSLGVGPALVLPPKNDCSQQPCKVGGTSAQGSKLCERQAELPATSCVAHPVLKNNNSSVRNVGRCARA
jgi:hypothetical protein